MITKRIFLISFLFFVFFAAFNARGDNTIQGLYTRVPGYDFNFDGEKIEIIEFMSFYCSHCYSFERWIPVIKGNFPRRIRWRVVPIFWGEGSPKPGEAYLLALAQGKGKEMKDAIFRAEFIEGKDIGKIEVLEELARNVGLNFDFSRKLRSGEKTNEAWEALKMANTYGVDSTPTLVIAGNIMTNPAMTGGGLKSFTDNVISILKSILKK